MSAITILPATASDKQRIIDILVLAFAADPFERWMYADPHEYLINYPLFMDALITRSFETNNAYYSQSYAGAALWLAPNVQLDDEKINTVLEQTIDKQKRADTMAVMEQMDRYHPHEPHWYLSIIGVDPAQRGQGLGSRLLQHTLAASRAGTGLSRINQSEEYFSL